MFERSPDVQAAFEKFRELDDVTATESGSTAADRPRAQGGRSRGLAHSTVLQTHGMVVMNAMDEIISSLDEPSEVVELILEQGKSHARFGDLTEDVFWAIEEPFILAVKHTLGDQYSSSLDRIYRKMMRFILTVLTIGFHEVTQPPPTSSPARPNSIFVIDPSSSASVLSPPPGSGGNSNHRPLFEPPRRPSVKALRAEESTSDDENASPSTAEQLNGDVSSRGDGAGVTFPSDFPTTANYAKDDRASSGPAGVLNGTINRITPPFYDYQIPLPGQVC